MTRFKNKIFKGKKITIMGLGIQGGGLGAVNFFHQQGAKLTITDLKKENELKKSLKKIKKIPATLILGRHREKDFSEADLIIKNPAVPPNSPYLKIAKKNNIPIKTDIDIFFDIIPTKQIIGITGTKGKSTTATLSYLFLKNKFPTILAGNIGISPLGVMPKIRKETKIVLELSSFELENLKKSPHISLITSLFPDHLNRYKTFSKYIQSKKSIFKYQKKDDILILNHDDKEVRKISKEAKSKIYFFSANFFEEWKIKKDEFKLINPSSLSGALVLANIFEIPEKIVRKIISEFKGVPNRQEIIPSKNGIVYINDTTATNPGSAILAIKTVKESYPKSKIFLLAGGSDKNLDYKNFAREIKKNIFFLYLFPGEASEKIKKGIKGFKNYLDIKTMSEAIKKSSSIAKKGDIILLSPGAASFSSFKNEFDRGKQFIKEIKRIK